ncbi:MAG: TonB-dependent receptor [Bacteroidales bacterium]|nr:TonB-dependent receptor [Bacteroidales bacterium]
MFSALLTALLAVSFSVQDTLPSATVLAFKESLPVAQLAAPVSSVRIDEAALAGQAELSARIPGLYAPQYGASLTSTIYLRGFGSRMDNPVLGLYLDGIPILDKNAYDLDYLDIRQGTLLHGPQATLYGRNALGGVLSLQTVSPRSVQGVRLTAEGGTAVTARIQASLYKGDHGFSAAFRHGGGYFRNQFTGRMCDPYDGAMLRWKWAPRATDRYQFEHILQASFSREGGFAYGRYERGNIQPVNYNDEGSYRRFTLLSGGRFQYRGGKVRLESAASVQLLADDMRMDQDFTPESIFTLRQRQRSGAVTAEVLLRPAGTFAHWRPVTGLFLFGQVKSLFAPVLFKREGIQSLILDNANAHIPADIGQLAIWNETLPIDSDFTIYTGGAALFHESVFSWGRWHLTAGLRLDGELAAMQYDCRAAVDYQFVPIMTAPQTYRLSYAGTASHFHLVLLPKLSLSFETSDSLLLYATLSKGFRAGGFNTQIFSDILQNRMMNGLMEELGVYLDRPAVSIGADATQYKPESAWNQEIGLRFRKDGFVLEASAYRMDGINQQLTVFPPGQSTGRMMTNAGRSRSLGAEVEMHYVSSRLSADLSYAFCDARFIRYESGTADYSGKRVPYVPAHTFYAGLSWRQSLGSRLMLLLRADLRGNGPLYWNEENSLREGFHLSPGARVSLQFPKMEFFLRGDRLLPHAYPVFYFKSVGREFFALSRPASLSLGVNVKL